MIQDSLFVGTSENKGMRDGSTRYQGWDNGIGGSYPMKGEGLVGWKMYDGGQGVDNCTFLNYPNPSEHGKVHTAIGIRLYNVDQMATVNRASKCSFVNVTNPIYFIDRGADGGKTSNLKDVDGSISGISGAHILPIRTSTKLLRADKEIHGSLAHTNTFNFGSLT